MLQQPKRRKKRPIHGGLKAVEVTRGKNGYGFTISGQQPCILSCIVSGSPADRAGLKTGDFLISVNGLNISGAPHDDVVRLIGSSSGVLALQIAENTNSSDSSDNEMHAKPSKSKYPPNRRHRNPGKTIGRSMEDLGVHDHRHGTEPMTNKYGHIVNRRRGDNSFEQAKMRSFSPGRELERHYAYEDQRQYRSMGIENLDPYAGDPYQSRRTRHTSTGPHRQGHRSNRHTKHTIITREHRLGLAKSMGVTETYATLPKAASLHAQSGHVHHGRDLSSSSSSSNNTYLAMNTVSRIHPDAHVIPSNVHHSVPNQGLQQQQDTFEEDDGVSLLDIPGNLRVIVGYVGSIEMPREAKVNTRLQSIRSAVRRLQVERKVHTMVLMVISLEGVTLVNTLGNTVAVYPSDKVAFSGVNPDDKRFFGIVTFHGFIDEDPEVISGGACHVFMVDPELSLHNMHANKAKNFGIQCTLNEETQQCMEFPKSAMLIVKCISRLYQSRPGGAYENGMAHLSSFEQPVNRAGVRGDSNSSNTDSGLGLASVRDRLPAVSQVCVVDVPSAGETPSPIQNLTGQQLETSGSTTLKSEQSLRWGLSGNSLFKTPPSVFKMAGEEGEEGDSQYPSMMSLDRHSNINGQVMPDVSTASVTSQDQSELSSSSDKLNVRAMPNPKGFNNMANKSDSWNDLLADQNSADNLRRSMQRFLQTRQKPLESGSDIDSIKSQDSSPPHSANHANIEESPVPPLPPRNMMRNPSGSSMGYTDKDKESSNQTDSGSSSVSGKSMRNKNRPGPADYKPIVLPHIQIRPPSPPQAPVIARPKAERYPTSKPPLPDSARTPARPMRPPMERPKSTPPIRSAGALDMDVDDDEYDSDPGNVSAFMETVEAKDNLDSGTATEVTKPQTKSFWGKTGLFKGKDNKKDKEKTPSKGVTKSGSFKQSRGFRTPKFKQSQSVNPSRCGSTESLVVKDAEIPGEKNLGGATSVTVITQNGVVSYQENGSTPIGRAAGWAVNFDRLLRDKSGLATFTEFLKKEFSEENIVFWKKCEEYKKIPTQKERKVRAQEIYRCHVETGASDPVNVDSQARSITEEGLETSAPELFDVAKKQIFQLMKQDSYTRFLKSEIYKDCVRAEIDGKPLPYSQDDTDSTQTNGHAGKEDTKRAKDERKSLKKSSSTTEDGGTEKRRRSLLPWGKKDKLARLMPKVMTDSDLRKNPRKEEHRSNGSGPGKMSLDLADLNTLQKEIKSIEKETAKATEAQKEVAQKFCRVIFPDGSTTVFYAKPGQSLRNVLTKLCDKRNLAVDLVDVYNNTTDKILNLQTDASQIGSKEIQLEKRVLFRLDLPSSKTSLGVKGRPSRPLKVVLGPILQRYGLKVEAISLHQAGGSQVVSLDTLTSEVDRQTLVLHSTGENQVSVKRRKSKDWGSLSGKTSKPPLPRMASEPCRLSGMSATDEATAQVFHSLFDGDAQLHAMFDEQGVFDPEKMEEKSVREEARASGLFSNILRKNSLDGKENASNNKTKRPVQRPAKPDKSTTSVPVGAVPRIVKTEHRDDLNVFSLLSKVSAQFDDQRGPLRKEDLELPDFLKPKRGGSLEGEFPLRRSEMHSSDTSLYEGPTDRADTLNRSRKLSNSEENLDNLLLKQYRRSTRGKGSYAGSAVTPGKIPFMDQSFSQDGVMPTHLEAEDYFSTMERPYSPDFNDSHIMEKSLVDIGMSSSKESKSASTNFKKPAMPITKGKQEEQQTTGNERTMGGEPSTPVPKIRKSLLSKKRQSSRQSDMESTCSEVSSHASSESQALNSDDLNDTLLPPSVSENSDSSTCSVPRKLSQQQRTYVSKHGNVLSPKRPLRTSKTKLQHHSEKHPIVNSETAFGDDGSAKTLHSQVDKSLDHTHQESHRQHVSGSESDCMPYDQVGPSSRSTTPSPTTHDLVLFADSSAEESIEHSTEPPIPTPKRRASLLKMQKSFGDGGKKEKEGAEEVQAEAVVDTGDEYDDVQISFV